MAEKKAGRQWGDLQADTVEGRNLALFLRGLLDRSGKQLRDLERPVGYGRSRLSEFFSGKKVPSQQFIIKTVEALTTPREQQIRRQEALALWQKATHPAPPAAHLTATRAVEETAAAALAGVAATAQNQAAHAQSELTKAQERNDCLTQERNRAQQIVTALSMLTVDLQQRITDLHNRHDTQAQQELGKLTHQLHTAQQDLQRARAGREEAEQLIRRLRQRSDELEEQLARLRAASPTPSADTSNLPPLPEDLKEAFFRADFEHMLATAQTFLDEGQTLRDETRDAFNLAPPRRTATQILQRWQTATHLLGRALGCLLMMTAAVAHLALSDAGATGWAIPLDLLGLTGLLLTADPWEPIRRLWPLLRAFAKRQPPTKQIRFSARSVAIRLVRCLTSILAAAVAAFSLFAATRWSPWWLSILLPATAALAAYTIVGNDRRLFLIVQEAVGTLAADLKTPRTRPALTTPRPLTVLTDADWLDARRQEIAEALTGSWRTTPLWIKATVLVSAAFVVLLTAAALLNPLSDHIGDAWDTSGLTTVIDQPVRAYLQTHTIGLSVTPDTVHVVWTASGAGLLIISYATGTFGARMTWILWGAATTAMVWMGTPGPARQVATGLAVIGWGIASILALRGLTLRPRISTNATVNNTLEEATPLQSETPANT